MMRRLASSPKPAARVRDIASTMSGSSSTARPYFVPL